MENVYTLREFRAKTKEAFDRADAQVDVVIERNGVRYVLIDESYYSELLKPDEPARTAEKAIAEVTEALKKAPVPIKSRFGLNSKAEVVQFTCKHGADPKFCKFAKPGKPCK